MSRMNWPQAVSNALCVWAIVGALGYLGTRRGFVLVVALMMIAPKVTK